MGVAIYISNTKIIVVRPSVRPSVTGGQWKRFDLETQAAVPRSGHRAFEARTR